MNPGYSFYSKGGKGGRFLFLLLCWLLAFSASRYARVWGQAPNLSRRGIAPQNIGVVESRTTHILFPQRVLSLDLGHGQLLAQIHPEQGQVVSVKAGHPEMETTTLTVITEEGGFYSFLVHYDPDPEVVNWVMGPPNWSFSSEQRALSAAERAEDLRRLEKKGPSSFQLRDGMGLVDLQIRGVYVHRNTYYVKGWVRNRSYRNLRFHPLSFSVQAKQRKKRRSRPGREILPLENNPPLRVDRGRIQWWVVSLPEFSMGPKEALVIRLEELGGHRLLQVQLSSKRWSRAIPLEKSGY